MISHFHICPLHVVARGWGEGIAAVQGSGMGDLTEVGEVINWSFTLLMSVSFIPLGNQREPVCGITESTEKECQGLFIHNMQRQGEVFHPTERLMAIRSPCAAVLDGRSAIRHMNEVTRSLRSVAFRCQLFPAPDWMKTVVLSWCMSSSQSCRQLWRWLDGVSPWQVSGMFTVGSLTAGSTRWQ